MNRYRKQILYNSFEREEHNICYGQKVLSCLVYLVRLASLSGQHSAVVWTECLQIPNLVQVQRWPMMNHFFFYFFNKFPNRSLLIICMEDSMNLNRVPNNQKIAFDLNVIFNNDYESLQFKYMSIYLYIILQRGEYNICYSQHISFIISCLGDVCPSLCLA